MYLTVINNFKLREFRHTTDGLVHYRCSNKSCKVNVWVDPVINLISRMTGNHDHIAETVTILRTLTGK